MCFPSCNIIIVGNHWQHSQISLLWIACPYIQFGISCIWHLCIEDMHWKLMQLQTLYLYSCKLQEYIMRVVHPHSACIPPLLLVLVRCTAVGLYDHHCVLPFKHSVSLITYTVHTYLCIHLRYVFASAIQIFQKKVIRILVLYVRCFAEKFAKLIPT